MERDHLHDADDDFLVEITSLDLPETPANTPRSFMRIPKVRTWLTILSLLTGSILVIIVLSSTILPTLIPARSQTPPPPPQQSLHTSIADVNVMFGVAYVIFDGALHALRVSDGHQQWADKLPNATSSTVVRDINGLLYIHYIEPWGAFIQTVQMADGKLVWTSQTFPLDSTLLAINNSTSYLLSGMLMSGNTLNAINSENGSLIWQYTLPTQTSLGATTSIQTDQDKIYITTTTKTEPQILSTLSNRDGSLLWQHNSPIHQLVMNPRRLVIQDNLVYITSDDSLIEVLRANDGSEVWHYKASPKLHMENITLQATIITSVEDGILKALRISDGQLLWTYKNDMGVFSVLLVNDDTVYIVTNGGFIVALRVSDGTQRWQTRPASPSFIAASLEVVDDIVYIPAMVSLITQEISLYALNASDGTLLWRRDMGASDAEILQVRNNLIFIGAGSTTIMTVLQVNDGTELWQEGISVPFSQYNGILALVDNITLLRSTTGIIEAHESRNGALLWRIPK